MPPVKVAFLGHSYVRDLSSVLDHESVCSEREIEFRFFFKPGATVRGISIDDIFVKPCIEWKPRILFLLLGGNDIRCGWDIRETFDIYKEFCDKLKEQLTDLVLITSTIEPRFAKANERFQTPPPEQYHVAAKAFNRLLKKWTLPDYRFLTWGANRLENINLFDKDRVHLNTTGKKVISHLVNDLVSRVVADIA